MVEVRLLLPRNCPILSVCLSVAIPNESLEAQEPEVGLVRSEQREDEGEEVRADQGQVNDDQLSGSKPHRVTAFLRL